MPKNSIYLTDGQVAQNDLDAIMSRIQSGANKGKLYQPSGVFYGDGTFSFSGYMCLHFVNIQESRLEKLHKAVASDESSFFIYHNRAEKEAFAFFRLNIGPVDERLSEGECIEVAKRYNKVFYDYFQAYTINGFSVANTTMQISGKVPLYQDTNTFTPRLFRDAKPFKYLEKLSKQKQKPVSEFPYCKVDFEVLLSEIIASKQVDGISDTAEERLKLGSAIASSLHQEGQKYFVEICRNNTRLEIDHAKFYNEIVTRPVCDYKYLYKVAEELGFNPVSKYTEEVLLMAVFLKDENYQLENAIDEIHLKTGITNRDEVIEKVFRGEYAITGSTSKGQEYKLIGQFIQAMVKPRLNKIKECVEVYDRIKDDYVDLTDKMVNTLHIDLQTRYNTLSLTKEKFNNYLESDKIPVYDPIEKLYVDNRKLYNTTPTGYIDKYLDCIEHTGDKEFVSKFFKKWYCGIFKQLIDPEFVNELMLVLTGPVGTLKTRTLTEFTLPDELNCYVNKLIYEKNMKTADLVQMISQNIMVVDDEANMLLKGNVDATKAMLSLNKLKIRLSYGRNPVGLKRKASFAATSNSRAIITDLHSNRRILPINVINIDREAIAKVDRLGMFIEAYRMLQRGFKCFLEPSEIDEINKNTISNRAVHIEEEAIRENFYYMNQEGEVYHPEGGEAAFFCKFNKLMTLNGVIQGLRLVSQTHNNSNYDVVRSILENILRVRYETSSSGTVKYYIGQIG